MEEMQKHFEAALNGLQEEVLVLSTKGSSLLMKLDEHVTLSKSGGRQARPRGGVED